MKRRCSDGLIIDIPEGELAQIIAEASDRTESADRRLKAEEIKAYGLSRIKSFIQEWDTIEEVRLIASLGPLLNWGSATANQILAKDTYLYVKDKLDQVKSAPIALVRNYNPETDANWPE